MKIAPALLLGLRATSLTSSMLRVTSVETARFETVRAWGATEAATICVAFSHPSVADSSLLFECLLNARLAAFNPSTVIAIVDYTQ